MIPPPAPLPPPSPRLRWLAGLALCGLLVGGGAISVSGFSPREDLPARCPLRRATGLRCPLCGMTRASFRLLHGDLRGALRRHPLAPLWFAIALLTVGGGLAGVAAGRWPRWPRGGGWVALPLLLVSWLVNLLWGAA